VALSSEKNGEIFHENPPVLGRWWRELVPLLVRLGTLRDVGKK